MLPNYPLEYYDFFVKFNEADYYTCHDLLEEMWMEDKSNLFLKGLLQMSVALYHYSYGNVKGTRLMMTVALEYLNDYRPKHWGLDLENIIGYIERCLSIIPKDLDKVPFSAINELPVLPPLFLYLEEN
ncbi:DUF309 domain-containing protein [Mesobacillus maritimus]|uniref:DUF309 domain-containing protein n=1 Tax=Mesobacillus maritimus TaxID=1643336 RepID=UPI0020413CE7|nr:DUF309 domain-containing protein [Mesobacillus maritimus]MCM3670237.1 DUF309 domain-containing protein [Mesobacillus maritimus]